MSLAPVWNTLKPNEKAGFHEQWFFKATDPNGQNALLVHFLLLSSANGFRRSVEVSALVFQRRENREVLKTALKQIHDIGAFGFKDGALTFGGCELSHVLARGAVSSKGKSVRWDFSVAEARKAEFTLIPEALTRSRFVKTAAESLGSDLRFTGRIEIEGGETLNWNGAPAVLGHISGKRNGHSWAWGHCNSFVDENGRAADFVFEGLSGRARLGGVVPTPKLSTFHFVYQGETYRFDSLWDAARSRSENSLTEWKFQADRGDLSFRGHLKAEHREFAGVSYEDTDGSMLYLATSALSDMTVLVYRRGKLESTFRAPGTAAFEVAARSRNPYVPTLV